MASYRYQGDTQGVLFDDDARSEVSRNMTYTSHARESDSGPSQRNVQSKQNSVTFQDDAECVCGAKQHVNRLQNEIKRKYKQFDQDHTKLRERWDELKKREKRIAETEREISLREEEMKSYKSYLQDKQHSISLLQQQNEATQRALLQRLDECAALEEECRHRLGEYESGLGDVGKKEAMLNETSRTLTARRDEIERLEHKLLLETEKLKDIRDQCAKAREQVSQEVKQHRRVVEEELEHVDAKKRKLDEMETSLLEEKSAFEEYMRSKKRDLEKRLQEVSESNDMNESIANSLKLREESLNQELQKLQSEKEELRMERERLQAEWKKVDDALDEIKSAKTELKGIKKACTKQKRMFDEEIERQSRHLNLSRQETQIPQAMASDSDLNYREIKQAELELQTRAKHVELAAEELRAKHIELTEYAAQLKQREIALKEGEHRLEQLQDTLEAREKELEELQEELMNTHARSQQNEAQMQQYREQMALLAIERNSLEGQRAQFEKQKLVKEAELNATRQRLERKEQELDAKLAKLRGLQDSKQLESRIESIRRAKTTSANVSNRPFSIPRAMAKNSGISMDHITVE